MVCATARIIREEDRTTRKSKKCWIPSRGSRFFQELETNIRNSTVVGRAATDATPDDAWEVRIIPETAGPYFHKSAPRSTRPLALERRRLLKDVGTAPTFDKGLSRSDTWRKCKD